MNRAACLILATTLGCCACAAPARPLPELPDSGSVQSRPPPKFSDLRPQALEWETGAMVLQGFVGVGYLDQVTIDGGGSTVEIDASELQNFPVVGGGAQWKLFGEKVDIGLEAMFSVGWQANAVAFASNGGGGTLAVNVDTLLVDVYGGPFISKFLGDRARVYAAAGPALQFVDYTQVDDNNNEVKATGSGVGGYFRAGFEFRLSNRDMLGLCVRRTGVNAQLDHDLGDFNVDSTQVVLTVTTGF